jgi:hypothetical protein
MLFSKGFALARGMRARMLIALTGLLVAFAVTPSLASATLRVANHNDPAGDPAVSTYQITGGSAPVTFQLGDASDRSFGPGPGVYVVQGRPPAGWAVADIQCVGASQANFQVDVPNGRVTVNHLQDAEDTCAFTNRRVTGGSVVAPGTGVAPQPLPSELPKVNLPKRAALLRVKSGRRFATASVRVTRNSVIRAQLLWRKTKVVGSTRVTKGAGTHDVRINVTPAMRRLMQRQGIKRAPLTLKVVVVPRSGGAAQVFRFGVRVLL